MESFYMKNIWHAIIPIVQFRWGISGNAARAKNVWRNAAFTRHGLKSGTAVPHSKTLSRGPAIPAMPYGLGLSGGTPDRATEDGRAPLQEPGIRPRISGWRDLC
jgi:hypothetical protein